MTPQLIIDMLAALLGLGAPALLPISMLLCLQIAAWCSVLVATAALVLLVGAAGGGRRADT